MCEKGKATAGRAGRIHEEAWGVLKEEEEKQEERRVFFNTEHPSLRDCC